MEGYGGLGDFGRLWVAAEVLGGCERLWDTSLREVTAAMRGSSWLREASVRAAAPVRHYHHHHHNQVYYLQKVQPPRRPRPLSHRADSIAAGLLASRRWRLCFTHGNRCHQDRGTTTRHRRHRLSFRRNARAETGSRRMTRHTGRATDSNTFTDG